MSDDRTEWAEERTDWAEDRTIMANERTFTSWIGAGLGSIGVAIGLEAVFGEFEPTWAAKSVASMFIFTAIVVFWLARRQADRTLERLQSNDAEPMPNRNFTIMATMLTIASVGTGIVLWSI